MRTLVTTKQRALKNSLVGPACRPVAGHAHQWSRSDQGQKFWPSSQQEDGLFFLMLQSNITVD
jgi:hypothetical protein